MNKVTTTEVVPAKRCKKSDKERKFDNIIKTLLNIYTSSSKGDNFVELCIDMTSKYFVEKYSKDCFKRS